MHQSAMVITLLPYVLCLIHQCPLKSMQNPRVFGGVGICLHDDYDIDIDVAIGKVRPQTLLLLVQWVLIRAI